MRTNAHACQKVSRRHLTVLLGLLVLLSYANSFTADWHLDDYDNILSKPEIRLDSSDPIAYGRDLLSTAVSGMRDRPVALATFAINWSIGKDNPVGYHVVNLAIHLLAACFLLQTMRALFATPRLNGSFSPAQADFVSVLAALLWALNPIQVQAVTYIVQRMASLCALFYILSLYHYLKARLSPTGTRKAAGFAAAGAFFILAVFTKENAVFLPLAVLLVEAVFFRHAELGSARIKWATASVFAAAAILAAGVLYFYDGNPMKMLENYNGRPFSVTERLFTQLRVIVFYLSLVFYPSPSRLSVVHDVALSTSLWHPWTTLLSMILIAGAAGLSVLRMRKWPLVSFAVLFFLINHVIESSILPLELVFEHRNYLPSMFLFLPVANALWRLMQIYRHRNRTVHGALVLFVPMLLLGFATGTYVRNQAWASEKLLWEDSLKKAPMSARPYCQLARSHYQVIGAHQTALALYERALPLRKDNVFQESLIYNNMAGIYYNAHNFEKAFEYWKKAWERYPRQAASKPKVELLYRQALALMNLGRGEEALSRLEEVIGAKPDLAKAFNLKAALMLKLGRPGEAIEALQRGLKLDPRNDRLLVNAGAYYALQGDHRKAYLLLHEALKLSREQRIVLLWLVKTALSEGNDARLARYVDRLLRSVDETELAAWLQRNFKARIYSDEFVFPEHDPGLLEAIDHRRPRPLVVTVSS